MRSTHSYFHKDAVAMLEAKDAEIDRLRAECDTWRNIAESHEPATSLRQAEFARMDLEVGRLRAELAAKAKRFDDAVEAIDLKDKELIQERTKSRDLRKRVAELENKNSYNLQIVREATARIAELEAERDALRLFSGAQAAVIKEMREG